MGEPALPLTHMAQFARVMLATTVYLHAQGFTHCGLRLKSFKFEQSEKAAFGTVMSAKVCLPRY